MSYSLRFSTASQDDPSSETTIADQLSGMDYSACVGLYQKPGCGTKPILSGDRGGAMQLVVFGILIAGMAVIGIRIARSIRARDKALEPTE